MKPMTHQFVEFIPDELEDGTIYISVSYATVAHNCCCGCGKEVVTPISPRDWKLTFDGETVSLTPSIGNWGFPCQSHYWIVRNDVRWAEQWSPEEIAGGRALDAWNKQQHYQQACKESVEHAPSASDPSGHPARTKPGFFSGLTKWLTG